MPEHNPGGGGRKGEISWYGPGEPEELPPNTVLVRPRRHSDNYMRGYVMNVAIRAVDTPYVLLGDADLAFPRYLVDVLSPTLAQVLRFYVVFVAEGQFSGQPRNGSSHRHAVAWKRCGTLHGSGSVDKARH